jgi:hypothetical protein
MTRAGPGITLAGDVFMAYAKEKMMKHTGILSGFSLGAVTLVLCSVLSGCAGAGSVAQPPMPNSGNVTPGADDGTQGSVQITSSMLGATPSFSSFAYHIMPVRKAGSSVKPSTIVYPADVAFGGGQVLTSTVQNDIFVNTTAKKVGSPGIYQQNFNLSSFIQVLDQYDGISSAGKFPVGTSYNATIPVYTNVISEDALLTVVHAAASLGGSGYGHEYHVFLAKGLDTCFDLSTDCYSPDNDATWTFCAYHGSVTYKDIGHVIYSVMPYQDVPGCGDIGIGPLPNPRPIDSTANTLSHETSESISDPDPDSGWSGEFGEIADICEVYFVKENLNGHKYIIQPEYSNAAHGCFF